MKKNALSSVVATVLLLLLTVAAVAVLSGIIIPFIKNTLYGSTECMMYEDSPSFVEKIDGVNYNCYMSEGSIVYHALSLKAEAGINESDENVQGIQISFQSSTNSKLFQIGKTESESSGGVSMMEGTYDYLQAGETISYRFELDKEYEKAEVRTILKSGKICKASDSIKLIRCTEDITP